MMMKQSEPPVEDMKKHQQKLKAASIKLKIERIDASLPSDLLIQVDQAKDKGTSSLL